MAHVRRDSNDVSRRQHWISVLLINRHSVRLGRRIFFSWGLLNQTSPMILRWRMMLRTTPRTLSRDSCTTSLAMTPQTLGQAEAPSGSAPPSECHWNLATHIRTEDVYKGCKVDYSGKKVTAQLFMDVLTGNAQRAKVWCLTVCSHEGMR